MTLKDKIKQYCKQKNIPITRFEKEAGLSNGYFNQVKKRPSKDKLESILRAFPDLNINWLLTGEGQMIKKTREEEYDEWFNSLTEQEQEMFLEEMEQHRFQEIEDSIAFERYKEESKQEEQLKWEEEEREFAYKMEQENYMDSPEAQTMGMYDNLSEEDITKLIALRMEQKMLDMYSEGRIYSREAVERIINLHQKEMAEAQKRIGKLEEELKRLRRMQADKGEVDKLQAPE